MTADDVSDLDVVGGHTRLDEPRLKVKDENEPRNGLKGLTAVFSLQV